MENQFQVGDVVQLKSGSPKWVVEKVDNHFISVIYWDGEEKKLQHILNIDHLFLVKAE